MGKWLPEHAPESLSSRHQFCNLELNRLGLARNDARRLPESISACWHRIAEYGCADNNTEERMQGVAQGMIE